MVQISGLPDTPLSAEWASVPTDYFGLQQLASGETCIPRHNVGSTVPLVSQKVQFTYWTAAKTEPVNNIALVSGNTAAGATPTYCAMGCYSVAANGNLTLLGACANDTAIFAATFTQYTRAVTTPFTKVAGQRYAFAVLVVSAASMPTIEGYNGTVTMASSLPTLLGAEISQSVLPASVTSGNVSGTSNACFGAVTP